MSTNIIIAGHLAADPESAVADSGTSWTRFRLITNDRYKDQHGTWVDGPPVAYRVTAFRRLAENITDTLRTGHGALVAGRLTVKSYRDADGNDRTTREILADHVGADLARATATITKNAAATVDDNPDPAPDEAPEEPSPF